MPATSKGVVLILISALLLYDFDALRLVTRLRPQFMFALLDKEPRPIAQDEIHTPSKPQVPIAGLGPAGTGANCGSTTRTGSGAAGDCGPDAPLERGLRWRRET
jgi:hypothetical protein